MTWDIERKKSLNKPFAVIEADMDFCGRVWGEDVCRPDDSIVSYIDTFSEPVVAVSDPLTDADGTLLESHTATGFTWIKDVTSDSLTINSNQINLQTATLYGNYINTVKPTNNTIEFSVDMLCDTPADENVLILTVRATGTSFTQPTDSWYEVFFDLFSGFQYVYIQRKGGPSNEQIAFALFPISFGVNHTCKVELDGYDINVYVDDVLAVSAYDNTIPLGGYVGVTAIQSDTWTTGDMIIDNFVIKSAELLQNHISDDSKTWIKSSDGSAVDWPVITDHVSIGGGLGYSYYYQNILGTNNTQVATAKVSFATAASTELRLIVRAANTSSDTSDRYYATLDADTKEVAIYKSVSSVVTKLVAAFLPTLAADTPLVFSLEVITDTLTVYVDNSAIISATDSSVATGGYTGLYVNTSPVGGGISIDEFYADVGEVVASKTLACRNTWPSCQDTSNFLLTTKTYTFYENVVDAPITDISGYPSLKKFTQTPSKITDGIGYRATLTFRLSDFTHHDKGVDPYVADRDYDPKTRGTFMGRFVKNNPFVIGREVRLRNGYLTDTFDWANFQTSTYVIDHIKGPDNNGDYVVTCKDVLYRLKDVMLPKPSQVKTTEAVTIDASTISVDLTGDKFLRVFNGGSYTDIEVTTSLPSYDSAGNLRSTPFTTITGAVPTDPSDTLYMPFYDSTGTFQPIALSSDGLADGDTVTVLIDDELIEGTYAGGIITVTQRGAGGTDPDTHDLGANVQTCIVVEDLPIDEVLVLLLTLAGVNPAYFDTAGWAEQASLLSLLRVTATLARPEKLTSILTKLAEQFTFRMWWDERYQLIKILAMFPQGDASLLPVISDELNILHRVKERPVRPTAVHSAEKMISQMWVNYKKLDLSKSDDLDNLGAQYIAINLSAEKPQALDGPKPKSLNAEFVNTEAHASLLASRWGAFYGDVQSTVDFYLSEKDIGEVWLGSEFIIDSDVLQDLSGANDNVRMQVIAAAEQDGAYKMTAEKSIFQGDRYAYIAAADASDYSSATEFEKATQAYICDAFGYIGDDKGYTII